jgi:hypothetical protein
MPGEDAFRDFLERTGVRLSVSRWPGSAGTRVAALPLTHWRMCGSTGRRVSAMTNPAGYLYRVGASKVRHRASGTRLSIIESSRQPRARSRARRLRESREATRGTGRISPVADSLVDWL